MYFRNFPKIEYDVLGDGTTRKMVNLAAFTKFDYSRLDKIAAYTYYNVEEGDRPDNVSYALYGTPEYHWTFFLINPHLRNYYDQWPKSASTVLNVCKSKYPHYAGLFNFRTHTLAGRFKIGEIVTGQQSGAAGYVRAKYPTDGYIVVEPFSGSFKEDGEAILGSETEDTLDCNAWVPQYLAPHHHINDLTGEYDEQGSAGTTPVTFYEWEVDRNNEFSRIRVIKPEYIREVVAEFIREMSK